WSGVAAVTSTFCILVKPSGALVIALIDLACLGLAALRLRAEWHSPQERKTTVRWIRQSLILFAGLNAFVLIASFASHYLSPTTLAFGNAAIEVMKTELHTTWPFMLSVIHMGLGY